MSSTDPARDPEAGFEDPVQLLSGGRLYQRLVVDRMGEAPDRLPARRTGLLLATAWLPLAILSAVSGQLVSTGGEHIAFLDDITVHIRLLLGLPALVLIEPFVRSRLALVLHYLGRGDLISSEERPKWDAAVERARRRRESIVAELVLLALALGLSVWGTFVAAFGMQGDIRSSDWRWTESGSPSLAGWWYLAVAGPVLLFHILRWLYRLGIWTSLLQSLSRLRLRLRPAHPDLSGGLGVLSLSQNSFSLFFGAIGIMSAGSIAHEILYSYHSVFEYKVPILAFVVICLLLLFGPLFLFARRARLAREAALAEYGVTANLMFNEFEANWFRSVRTGPPEGALDPSLVTDFSSVFGNIRGMRNVPIEPQAVIASVIVLLLPYLPLLLTAMSLQEILERVAKAVL